jgi:NAD(P)H dehydrogenase (quinone)
MPGSPEPQVIDINIWRTIMYAITGITGKVGGALARSLLAEGLPVTAVLRDEVKAAEWKSRGCDIALAEMDDAASLTSAFRDAAGVFILPPSEFDPEPGFPEAKRVIAAVAAALAEARPGKIVCLSTIGADAPHENLLTQRTLMERSLDEVGLPVAFLRPAWFMENALWDVPSARDEGVLHSFLQPADKSFAMVATQDVGRQAATLLREDWSGTRVVELEGPARVSPNDLAQAFAVVLGRPVRVETVPRESWETIFRAQGTLNPLPRIRMLDGFNEGWIEFRDYGRAAMKGTTTLENVLAELVKAAESKSAA